MAEKSWVKSWMLSPRAFAEMVWGTIAPGDDVPGRIAEAVTAYADAAAREALAAERRELVDWLHQNEDAPTHTIVDAVNGQRKMRED